MKTYELKATRQKSYYGKAKILESDNVIALCSYDTIVCYIDKQTNEFFRTWWGWSATTSKHVADFMRLNGLEPLCKKDWEKLEVKPSLF